MKKYKYLALSLAVALGVSSCSLDTNTYDQKQGSEAYTSLKDIQARLNGVYYWTGYYYFLGNYAVAIGDFAAGISAGSTSSGHFYSYSSFTFDDTEQELEYMWEGGYKIITGATESINYADKMIADGTITESNQGTAYYYIGQCYALKALAQYYLVNYFGLPYSDANKSSLGIIVIDKEIPEALSSVKRSTVEESYTQIKNDIAAAEEAFSKYEESYYAANGKAPDYSAYYLTPMGLQALKARTYLALGDYATAETAAKEALSLKGATGTADDNTPAYADYVSMWGKTAVSGEDLFTIVKSSDDNLSANALNTLYGSYYCTLQNTTIAKLGANDYRRDLLRKGDGGGTSIIKYDGAAEQAVTNIPIFRKSEMSLIIAECEARIGSISEAQNYLMYTAKRDADITSTADLPSTTEDLLTFIADERIREFFGEGHRFFDARRMGLKISGDNFQDWDVQKFVFPIPAAEINAGFGCQQNEGWEDNLPR